MLKLLFFTQVIFAQNNISEEVIDSIIDTPKEQSVDFQVSGASTKRSVTSQKKKPLKSQSISGNLENQLLRSKIVDEIKVPTQIPKNTIFNKDVDLLPGTVFKTLIQSDIIAYVGSASPIESIVLEGDYKGSILIGNATMDVQTKRVNISFSQIRKKNSKVSYSISGLVRDKTGDLGLDATHESFYWNYFFAEAALNTASGFANATTERTKNRDGNYEIAPSIDSSTKQGVAVGLAKAGERISERLRSQPEYVTAKGPFVVQVVILE